METLTLKSEKVLYKGYTIEKNIKHHPHELDFMIYPTADGADHDMDWNGQSWKYTGNCKWADSIEDAKLTVDELIFKRIEVCQQRESYLSFHIENGPAEWKKEFTEKLEAVRKEQAELTPLIGNIT